MLGTGECGGKRGIWREQRGAAEEDKPLQGGTHTDVLHMTLWSMDADLPVRSFGSWFRCESAAVILNT